MILLVQTVSIVHMHSDIISLCLLEKAGGFYNRIFYGNFLYNFFYLFLLPLHEIRSLAEQS